MMKRILLIFMLMGSVATVTACERPSDGPGGANGFG